MKLLYGGLAALAAFWLVLYEFNESPGVGKYSRVDKLLVYEIAIVFTFAALVMLFSRTSWSFRAVGLFLTSVGTATLYWLSSFLASGKQVSAGTREAWLDLARAGLAIGGIMVFIGLIWYVGGRIYLRDELREIP
jgi:hypothetical protein